MSWHHYCPVASKGPSNHDPYPWPEKELCDKILAPLSFKTAKMRSQEARGGRMLTEVPNCESFNISKLEHLKDPLLQKFGNNWPDARYPDSQDTVETLAVLNEADSHFSSWTFWESTIVWNLTSSGSLNTNLAKVLARPYPQAIAGTPTKVHLVCPNG